MRPAIGLTAWLCVAGAVAEEPGGLAPDPASSAAFAELIIAAQSKHHATTPAELAARRKAVVQALAQVRQSLTDVPSGGVLEHDLRLIELDAELARDAPSVGRLRHVYRPLRGQRWELPAVVLGRLRSSVAAYAAAVDNRSPESEAQVRERLAKLASDWQAFVRQPSNGTLEPVRQAVGGLVDLPVGADVVRWLRQHYSRPNYRLRVARSYLEKKLVRAIDVNHPFNQQQQGITLNGTVLAHDQAHTSIRPGQLGNLELNVHANLPLTIPMTAHSSRISLSAVGRANVQATELVTLTQDGTTMVAEPQVQVCYHTDVNCVDLNAGSMVKNLTRELVQRVAQRKVSEHDPELQSQARSQLAARIKAECEEMAEEVSALLTDFAWNPLHANDVTTRSCYRSDETSVERLAHYNTRWQLSAPAAPPEPPGQPTLSIALHESALNNSNAIFAGTRLTETRFVEIFVTVLKLELGDTGARPTRRVASALTLTEDRPLEIQFADGSFTVRMQVQAYEHEGQPRVDGPWLVTARYELSPTAGRLELKRAGLPRVEPLAGGNAEPGALPQTLDRFMPPQASMPWAQQTSSTDDAQQLHLAGLVIDQGWLLVWLNETPNPTSAQAPVLAR